MKRVILAAALVLAWSNAAHAQQVWLSLGGGYLSQSDEFDHTVALPEHLETAVVSGTYPASGGTLIDATAHVTVAPAWAIAGGIGVFRSSSDVQLRGRIPHPLYFAQPRAAEQQLDDVGHHEIMLRAELAWIRAVAGRMRVSLSAGPMAVRASQELATTFSVRELAYPYDEVEIAPSTRAEAGWGLGATAAVAASWMATERLAIGVTARYSRASVSLLDHSVEAGGPSVIGAVSYRVR
jgi:hypothetical protein